MGARGDRELLCQGYLRSGERKSTDRICAGSGRGSPGSERQHVVLPKHSGLRLSRARTAEAGQKAAAGVKIIN